MRMPSWRWMAVPMMVVVLWAGAGPPAWAEDAGEVSVATPARSGYTLREAWRDLVRYYQAGGSTMHALLFVSVVTLAFILERSFRLRRKVVAPLGLADKARQLWREGKLDELQKLCTKRRKSTMEKVILFLLEYRSSNLADVNTGASDIAARDRDRHMMLTSPLGVCAVLAPLLGLFGTVVGMVEAFEIVAIAGALGDPAMLSASISKALLTTVFGLLIAIPGVFVFNFFRLRTHYLYCELDEELSVMINEWFMKKGA